MSTPTEPVPVETIYKKVFLNRATNYIPRNVLKVLKTPFTENIYEARHSENELEDTMVNVLVRKRQLEVELCGTANEASEGFAHVQDKESVLQLVRDSDVLIFDINSNKEDIGDVYMALQALEDEWDHIEQPKTLILLSTIMTWTRSQPLGNSDIAIPFSEEDFRRRRAHPSYLEHLKIEKLVTKLGSKDRNKLRSFVVACGVCYGDGECAFHNLFKLAWLNTKELPVYGAGDNLIPSIYVNDLGRAIQSIIYNPPKNRYLIAMDDSLPQLKDIVGAISLHLGSGLVKLVSRDEALLDDSLDQASFNQMTVNLRMESNFMKENAYMQWEARDGMVKCMAQLVQEYTLVRGLKPFRICILGPPTVGKTTAVKILCEHYGLHRIEPNELLDQALEQLRESEEKLEKEDIDEETHRQATEDAALRRELLDCKDEHTGRYERVDDKIMTRYIREKLLSRPCQNQGFVLDGYPITKPQAKLLFDAEHEDDDSDDESDPSALASHFDPSVTPENVFLLEASEEWLRQRILRLDEIEVMRTQNTEENFLKRLEDYNTMLIEDEKSTNFFHRRAIPVVHLDVTSLQQSPLSSPSKSLTNQPPQLTPLSMKMMEVIGAPRNFPLTPGELNARIRQQELDAVKEEVRRKDENEVAQRNAVDKKKQRIAIEATKLEATLREEYEMFDSQSLPMRLYLMKHVMPVLTEGIINCVRERPEDPRDYLAKHLFYNNPLENLK